MFLTTLALTAMLASSQIIAVLAGSSDDHTGDFGKYLAESAGRMSVTRPWIVVAETPWDKDPSIQVWGTQYNEMRIVVVHRPYLQQADARIRHAASHEICHIKLNHPLRANGSTDREEKEAESCVFKDMGAKLYVDYVLIMAGNNRRYAHLNDYPRGYLENWYARIYGK